MVTLRKSGPPFVDYSRIIQKGFVQRSFQIALNLDRTEKDPLALLLIKSPLMIREKEGTFKVDCSTKWHIFCTYKNKHTPFSLVG